MTRLFLKLKIISKLWCRFQFAAITDLVPHTRKDLIKLVCTLVYTGACQLVGHMLVQQVFLFVLNLGKLSHYNNTHRHTDTVHSGEGNNHWTQSGCEVFHNEDKLMSEHHQHVKAQKSQHFEKLLFTPPMLVSLGLFPPSPSILLPPSLLCVIYTLSLTLSLSDALLSKSRLLCSELFCDLFLIFVSTLPNGRWTERKGQDTLTHSITAWCGWQE